MNYRHAFHAGNHADVLKHIVLLALLDALKKKDAPFFVLDTHAGRGRYLLAAPESRKNGEADAGILKLMGEAKMPEVVERYLRAVEANSPGGALSAYPGSPLLVAQARYERGISTYLDVTDAQRSALAADRAAAQIRTQRLLASVAVARALGGGWSEAPAMATVR